MADIDSPYDWPKEFPSLSSIDALLRCPICNEFFDETAANTLPCTHTHCAECTLNYINQHQKCPTCNAVCNSESSMRKVPILNEIALLFKEFRRVSLDFQKKFDQTYFLETQQFILLEQLKREQITLDTTSRPNPSTNRTSERIRDLKTEANSASPKNTTVNHKEKSIGSPLFGKNVLKKQKTGIKSEIFRKKDGDLECPACLQLGFSPSTLDTHLEKFCFSRFAMEEEVIIIGDDEKEPIKNIPQETIIEESAPNAQLKDMDKNELKRKYTEEKSYELVEEVFDEDFTDDSAPKKLKFFGFDNKDYSNFVRPKREKKKIEELPILPLIPWGSLSITEIRKRLEEYGIPTTGSKEDLKKRYTKFRHLVIKNNQIPLQNRKSKKEILKELKDFEQQGKDSQQGSASFALNTDSNSTSHDDSEESRILIEKHNLKYDNVYNELISQAKPKRKRKESSNDDVNELNVKRETIGKNET
ncbi:E3 ubiquitin-protein ligase rad18 [Clydaea vesicula]|uniref:Postreplication repair E3 ubiquitin-protein ligase RAD18 n=1 Tax=Clydaea vesicula TaxID=447962 RepID=A0AAD5TUV0_9FUNG|nr:E3 ubiquitin-protein ligase rad18 [Clydaea vesicula]